MKLVSSIPQTLWLFPLITIQVFLFGYLSPGNLVLSTELIILICHGKEIRKLTSERISDKGLSTRTRWTSRIVKLTINSFQLYSRSLLVLLRLTPSFHGCLLLRVYALLTRVRAAHSCTRGALVCARLTRVRAAHSCTRGSLVYARLTHVRAAPSCTCGSLVYARLTRLRAAHSCTRGSLVYARLTRVANMIVVSFAENLKLVKAILCAGLYPNVAKLEHHPRLKRWALS